MRTATLMPDFGFTSILYLSILFFVFLFHKLLCVICFRFIWNESSLLYLSSLAPRWPLCSSCFDGKMTTLSGLGLVVFSLCYNVDTITMV